MTREAAGSVWAVPGSGEPHGRPDVASTLLGLFEELHRQVRAEIEDLDDDGLNWIPAVDANAIATIVTHIVGSEAETMRAVAGVPSVRDREQEFASGPRDGQDLFRQLRTADDLIDELRPQITSSRLRTRVALPTLAVHDRRTGLSWLAGNYGHAREHVGHIQLTTQLYRAAGPEATLRRW
jgi:hypothetical protein